MLFVLSDLHLWISLSILYTPRVSFPCSIFSSGAL